MEIDKSKENIQPLRGGRNPLQLEAALAAHHDPSGDTRHLLLHQKEEHEACIRTYEGSDPLEPWFNYIQWIEQCFPKHGHEGHIDKMIKECLQKFEKDERYFQDRRFVKLWIKYIDCLTNPLEIYQRLYNSGIGVEVAEFYRAWACYCEESGDFKKANQVYVLGLQARAQPYDELEQAHMNFQLYFAQRMLHDDSPTKRKAASALAETRMALTSLKSFKRRNIASVPSQRTGENIRSVIPGVVRQQAGSSQVREPASNIMVNVFEDAPSTSQAPIPVAEDPGPASLLQSCDNVENEREVGMWTNAKAKMVHAPVVPHQPLPFTPYEDEDLILSANHMAYCLDDLQSFVIPLCLPEPPDSTKITCYNKALVYVDGTEYSLEEIRSRKHISKKHIQLQKLTQAVTAPFNPSTSFSVKETDAASQYSALETLANCALGSENDFDHLMPLAIPAIQNITKVQNIHSPGEPKILVNLDSKEFSELANPRKNYENQRPADYMKENSMERRPSCSAYGDDDAVNNYGKNKLAEEFNRSLMGNLHGDSVTVNTKEARWELRNLFTDNDILLQEESSEGYMSSFSIHKSVVTSSSIEPSMVQPLVQQFDVPKFDIHEDRTMTMTLNINKDQVEENIRAPVEVDHRNPLQDDLRALPEDKENAPKFTVPIATVAPANITKTAYYEEPSCTQVFNFNIKNSSTPNMAQFKRLNSHTELAVNKNNNNKTPGVRKFSMDESSMEMQGPGEGAEGAGEAARCETEHHGNGEVQQNGLSVIMESTREFNSKSSASSASSGMQSTRNALGFTSQNPYSNVNYDSVYAQQPVTDPTTSKRASITVQPRNANGQFAKTYTPKSQPIPEHKAIPPYQEYAQKPGYNGYPAQRTMQVHGYQQNYGMYQQQQPQQQQYASPQMTTQYPVQQGYQSPSANSYHSPQHPGLQSPHHMQSPTPTVQPGFQSPQQNYQMGYQSPGHSVPSSSQPYANARPEYQHNEYQANRQAYAQQNFQNPPHQSQYPNAHFQRNANYPQGYTQNYNDPYLNQSPYGSNANNSYHNQNYNMPHNAYRQPPKSAENPYGYPNANANQMPFQVYQSPNQSMEHSNSQNQAQPRPQPMQTSPSEPYVKQEYPNQNAMQYKPQANEQSDLKSQNRIAEIPKENQNTSPNSTNMMSNQSPAHYKSPTSILRSIRHEQQHGKPASGTPDTGFSNQFLHFITPKNEPKDNANTPKFTNSPNISQKMHNNLYVSSPEQGQIPPSTGQSDSESKDGMTARSATPIQSAKTSQLDKQKDLSKRQLDFEHRPEYQSEDSRDSMSKESRISSIQSRPSVHSDGFGMDMDSENSMECAAFKSTHSISMVETHEIPRPADIDFPDIIDPFNKKILNSLLEYVKFPNKTHSAGYVEVRSVPKLQGSAVVTVGNHKFSVEKQLGKGNYGAVFCCLDLLYNKPVALKYQKPGRPWEFYICQEIKARIKDPFMLPGYMDIEVAFLGENASIFVSELSKYGSLLDVANKVRVATSKCINECIVMLLTSEMLSIVHYLHKAEIIHADIKPDNFLLMKIPTQEWRTPSLQLIDLGCSIDMSLFPEETTFREMISTEGFTCTEMREGKPWTYQTDFYCLAGTIHVILMGSYMKVANKLGQWNIDKKLPRYMNSSLWDKIFTTLLNVPDCNNLPELLDLKSQVDNVLAGMDVALSSQLRSFANVLKSR